MATMAGSTRNSTYRKHFSKTDTQALIAAYEQTRRT